MIDRVISELMKIGFERQTFDGKQMEHYIKKGISPVLFEDGLESLVKPIWQLETPDEINTLLIVAARKNLIWSASIMQRIRKKRGGEILHSGGLICHLDGSTELIIKRFQLLAFTFQIVGAPMPKQLEEFLKSEFSLYQE